MSTSSKFVNKITRKNCSFTLLETCQGCFLRNLQKLCENVFSRKMWKIISERARVEFLNLSLQFIENVKMYYIALSACKNIASQTG